VQRLDGHFGYNGLNETIPHLAMGIASREGFRRDLGDEVIGQGSVLGPKLLICRFRLLRKAHDIASGVGVALQVELKIAAEQRHCHRPPGQQRHHVSGGITVVGGLLSGVGTVDTIITRGGTVAPGGNSPGVLTVDGPITFNPAATLSILLNGTAVGTGYSQLAVGGDIDLGGSTLSLTFGFAPPVGSTFEILTNAGSTPISGTFNGLAEGAVFTHGGYQFQITYQGGTGNISAVLTGLA
jgi:hypothetical protein